MMVTAEALEQPLPSVPVTVYVVVVIGVAEGFATAALLKPVAGDQE